MPCHSDYLKRSGIEEESNKVLFALFELGIDVGPHDSYYGRPATIDEDTAKLCAILKTKSVTEIQNLSLETQIWWRDHQIADQKREELIKDSNENKKYRESGLAKLTKEERHALGLDWA